MPGMTIVRKFEFGNHNTYYMKKVLQIANLLLQKAKDESCGEELMTNLKLQKMLYYEQGFHLAYFGTPLFDDDIEAWQYGPVVPFVYNYFKKNGANGLVPDGNLYAFSNQKEKELFDEVFRVYGKYSAIGLMNMTHNEKPWKSAGTPCVGNVISQDSLKSFFQTRLA